MDLYGNLAGLLLYGCPDVCIAGSEPITQLGEALDNAASINVQYGPADGAGLSHAKSCSCPYALGSGHSLVARNRAKLPRDVKQLAILIDV